MVKFPHPRIPASRIPQPAAPHPRIPHPAARSPASPHPAARIPHPATLMFGTDLANLFVTHATSVLDVFITRVVRSRFFLVQHGRVFSRLCETIAFLQFRQFNPVFFYAKLRKRSFLVNFFLSVGRISSEPPKLNCRKRGITRQPASLAQAATPLAALRGGG